MTTTVTPLGNNSCAVAYAPGTTEADILLAIQNYVILHGWEIHDAEYNVIRSLCANGVDYKYVRLRAESGYMYTEVYSEWDAVAHTGVNPAHYSNTYNYAQRLTASAGGYMFVFCTGRWLIMQCRLNTEELGSTTHNAWSGCMEFSEDSSAPAAKPYAFTHGSLLLGSGVGGSNMYSYAMPIDEYGYTGSSASRANSISTVIGSNTYNRALVSDLPTTTNFIGVPGENFVFTPYAIRKLHDTENFVRGRFFGFKILAKELGMFMDKIEIDVDNQQFYSRDGVATDHFILTSSYGNSRFAIPA